MLWYMENEKRRKSICLLEEFHSISRKKEIGWWNKYKWVKYHFSNNTKLL